MTIFFPLFLTHDEVLPLFISFFVCFSFCQTLLVSLTINHHSSLPLSYYSWSSVSTSLPLHLAVITYLTLASVSNLAHPLSLSLCLSLFRTPFLTLFLSIPQSLSVSLSHQTLSHCLSLSIPLFHLVSSESMMILVPSLLDYDIYHRQRAKPH